MTSGVLARRSQRRKSDLRPCLPLAGLPLPARRHAGSSKQAVMQVGRSLGLSLYPHFEICTIHIFERATGYKRPHQTRCIYVSMLQLPPLLLTFQVGVQVVYHWARHGKVPTQASRQTTHASTPPGVLRGAESNRDPRDQVRPDRAYNSPAYCGPAVRGERERETAGRVSSTGLVSGFVGLFLH